jgi:hypothetical protein
VTIRRNTGRTFATVRHRTKRTKGRLSRETGLAVAFKLMTSAPKIWRKRDGQNRLPKIIQGISFPRCDPPTSICRLIKRHQLLRITLEVGRGDRGSGHPDLPAFGARPFTACRNAVADVAPPADSTGQHSGRSRCLTLSKTPPASKPFYQPQRPIRGAPAVRERPAPGPSLQAGP